MSARRCLVLLAVVFGSGTRAGADDPLPAEARLRLGPILPEGRRTTYLGIRAVAWSPGAGRREALFG
jgi:hypothetical protein